MNNNAAPTSRHCSVCGKKECRATKLLICGKCSSPSYLLCGTTCQRKDWKRHKRTECSSAVLRVVDGLPTDPCDCSICTDDGKKDDEDVVSEFFNDLHMVRGSKDCYKFIHDTSCTSVTVNGKPCNLVQVPLTDEELDRIAYPFPHLVYMGHNMLDQVKTFYAADGKAFTVRELADAIAKAEKKNRDKLDLTGGMGGGWYFEGLRPHENNEPHTFASYWGTNMVSSRSGFFVCGIGFNPLTSRMHAMDMEDGE
jgi:hypothetical protein